MQLISIISALATVATVVHAVPASTIHRPVTFNGHPWSAANVTDVHAPGDVPSKRDGQPRWKIIGYADPDCKGKVLFEEEGDRWGLCRDVKVPARSMFVNALGGSRTYFWNKPNGCTYTGGETPVGAQMLWWDFPQPLGEYKPVCMTHDDIYGYKMDRTPKN